MGAITDDEIDKLTVMYKGDKGRDASDKIRGFVFQDYIAIMCLLGNNVDYVCSEYLEDVDVVSNDGTFKFIQSKYYPSSDLKYKEVFTDLYYQFLRLKMLHSSLKVEPCLYIHTFKVINVPSIENMKLYIGCGELPENVVYPDANDSKDFLVKEVNSCGKKEKQKEKLFSEMASVESLTEFINSCKVVPLKSLDEYRTEVKEQLAKTFPSDESCIELGKWQLVLLGLALSRIQQRYSLDTTDFNKIRIAKIEFDQYMISSAHLRSEQSIVYYLIGITNELHSKIIEDNELNVLDTYMLEQISKKTMQWIMNIGNTVEGQYQLLNTISVKAASKIRNYKELPVNKKLFMMAENSEGYEYFLLNLWKIMLNVCRSEVDNTTGSVSNKDLFDPSHYIDQSVTDYVCFHFPEDRLFKEAIILPDGTSRFKTRLKDIVERILYVEPKPGKWFFRNHGVIWGKNYYSYSTADVCEDYSVANLGEDDFYIECMRCIEVDAGDWGKYENCSDCIFSEKCFREGEIK